MSATHTRNRKGAKLKKKVLTSFGEACTCTPLINSVSTLSIAVICNAHSTEVW